MAESVFQLKVSLLHIQPAIWRRLRVPAGASLAELHRVLQIAFGWQETHLHEFRIGRKAWGPPDPDGGLDVQDESKARLDEVARAKSKLLYTYDFGDDWHHEIVVERVEPLAPGSSAFACLDGRRAGPPEDCGGPWGYGELVEILADPEHPEREERLDWLGADWQPEAFDVVAVDRRLRSLGARSSRPATVARRNGAKKSTVH